MAADRPTASQQTRLRWRPRDESPRVVFAGQPVPGGPDGGGELAGYAVTVESGAVVVRHTGPLNTRIIEYARRAVAVVAAEGRLTRILVDLSSASSGLSTVEVFELCAEQRVVLPPLSTVAIVYRPSQFPAEDVTLAETVSLNRGVNLRAFTDHQAARRWLALRSPGPASS